MCKRTNARIPKRYVRQKKRRKSDQEKTQRETSRRGRMSRVGRRGIERKRGMLETTTDQRTAVVTETKTENKKRHTPLTEVTNWFPPPPPQSACGRLDA